MPGSSEGARRVQRAKAAGRSPHVRREIPVGFYSALAAVTLLGVAAIGYSRYEVAHPASATAGQLPPRVGQTWYVAVGFEVCGHFVPPLAAGAGSSSGMTSLGNGVVKVEPRTPAQTGSAANLARFLAAAGVRISANGVTLPGGHTYSTASCGSRPLSVRYATWSSLLATTPTVRTRAAAVPMVNGEVVTVAVLAHGQSPSQPPNAANLANK